MFLVTGTMIKLREVLIDFEQNQDTDTMFCCLGMVLCFVLSRYVTMFSVSSMLMCSKYDTIFVLQVC